LRSLVCIVLKKSACCLRCIFVVLSPYNITTSLLFPREDLNWTKSTLISQKANGSLAYYPNRPHCVDAQFTDLIKAGLLK
jgi:hypothetical protein